MTLTKNSHFPQTAAFVRLRTADTLSAVRSQQNVEHACLPSAFLIIQQFLRIFKYIIEVKALFLNYLQSII